MGLSILAQESKLVEKVAIRKLDGNEQNVFPNRDNFFNCMNGASFKTDMPFKKCFYSK